jgi:hypothetical protein
MREHEGFLRGAGVALIVASLAFMAVFAYLAASFGYPEVLDRSAAEVLPALLRGGTPLRTVWFLYGALPLVFVVAGLASGRLIERGAPALRGVGVGAAVATGVAMMAGLLRWPTIEWTLARHWQAAPAAEQGALAAMFDASNLFLGTLVGEFVGEMCTAVWFLVVAVTFRRLGWRVLGGLGLAAAALMAISALRNITTLVDPIAAINNYALPLWLITLGVAFLRPPAQAAAEVRPAGAVAAT